MSSWLFVSNLGCTMTMAESFDSPISLLSNMSSDGAATVAMPSLLSYEDSGRKAILVAKATTVMASKIQKAAALDDKSGKG
jgi:hypothetical protein